MVTCLAREQACGQAGVSQAGVSNLKSHWRGGRSCRPRGRAGLPALPEDDSLFPGSAKPGMTQPGLSQSRAWEERCTRAALYSCHTRALSSVASSRSSKGTCAGLCPAQRVQEGLVTEINSFRYSPLTSPCSQALRSPINLSSEGNLNSLAKVPPNQMQKISVMSSNRAYKIK